MTAMDWPSVALVVSPIWIIPSTLVLMKPDLRPREPVSTEGKTAAFDEQGKRAALDAANAPTLIAVLVSSW